MTAPKRKIRLRVKKSKRFNREIFDDVRLERGLSLNQLALEVEFSAQTIRRAFVLGNDPHPATVKKLGEFLGIPPKKWYIRINDTTDKASE